MKGDAAAKYKLMTETPVKRLVCRMAVPTIISMMITAIYNMADTLFVGKIGTSATAAVGITFSFMALIQAVGFLFGHGSGNPISRALGRKDFDEASIFASLGFFSSLFFGLMIMTVALVFTEPIARLLGATDTVLPYAVSYIRMLAPGTPFMVVSFTLNNQLRLEGCASYAMLGIASGAVLNVILDPIFIFVLKMGIGGAALATVIGQFVGFCILFSGTFLKSSVRIRIKNFKPSVKRIALILSCGLPSFGRQGFSCAATICLNNAAGNYGDAAIAAFSIVTRITMFAYSALLGFGQGFQPVCGFNYGAERYDRVRAAFWFCVRVGTIAATVFALTGAIFAPQIVALFRNDPEVIATGARTLRFQCLSFPTLGLITPVNMLFQNLGKTVRAGVISIARQGLFFLPLMYLLGFVFGIYGLMASQAAADILTFIFCVPFTFSIMKELNKGKELKENSQNN